MNIRGIGRKWLNGTAATAAMVMFAQAVPAYAQEQSFRFDIPAQDLGSSLKAFARASKQQVAFDAKAVQGKHAPALRGSYSASAALGILLANSGLSVDRGRSGLFIIRAGAAQSDSSSGAEAALAPAQQASETPDILVTGSRIRRVGFDTLQPANSVSGDKVRALGYNNVAEAVNTLPAFGTPTSGSGGQNTQTVGQNFVNAFGLGTGRTLTLVNGRRVVSQASPGNAVDPGLQVDLNIIPTLLVDRVETIYTGGAPIYGSDAIAGTVNVILKNKYRGVLLDAQNGISSRGDGYNYRLGILAGTDFADGRGHVVVAGEYNHVSGVPGTARKKISTNYTYCNNPANKTATDGIPDQIICQGADAFSLVPLTGGPSPARGNFYPVNRTSNAFVVNGEPLLFSLDGQSLITAAQAHLGTPVSTSGAAGADATNNPYVVNQAETNSLLSPVTRKVVSGQASYDLSDHITVYGEGLYAKTNAVDQFNQGGFSSVLFPANGGQIAVRLDNPFLNAAERATIASFAPPGIDTNRDGVADTPGFYLARYNEDLLRGAPTFRSQQVYRFVGGLKGDFHIGGRDWNWDASYNYGRTHSVVRSPVINLTRFGLALDSVRNGSGQVVCRVTVNPAAASGIGAATPTPVSASDIGGCLPFNPLGYATTPNLGAVRDYLLQDVVQDTVLEQQIAEASLSGSPFSLPAGDVSLAAGVTYRQERARYSGTEQNQGFYVGDVAGPISGRFHTKEGYAETVIPLLSRRNGFSLPLIASLQFEGAARYVDNSYAGRAWTWTAGGRLGLHLPLVGDSLTVRGNVTHAVRSPSFAELLTPTSSTTGFGNDPCDPRFISSGASPSVRAASCAAQVAALRGTLPSGFSLANFTSSIVNVVVPGTNSGNPGLDNERSKSWTLGLLFAPSGIPGLRASVDWTDIRIDNAIVSSTLTQLFAACYDNGGVGSSEACDRFTRDPTTFQITGFQLGFINAAQRRFSGLLVDIQYRFSLSGLNVPGSLTVGGTGFYTNRNEQRINRGDLDILAGERGFEKYKAQGTIQYATEHFSALWQTTYVSHGVIDEQASPERRSPGTFGAFWQHDLSLAVMPVDNLELRFVVRNLFDQTDSIERIAAKTTNAVIGGANLFSNAIGRTFTFGAKVHF